MAEKLEALKTWLKANWKGIALLYLIAEKIVSNTATTTDDKIFSYIKELIQASVGQ